LAYQKRTKRPLVTHQKRLKVFLLSARESNPGELNILCRKKGPGRQPREARRRLIPFLDK
jgi:hypothetical protein